MSFIRDHFDKLLVSFFLLVTMALVSIFTVLAIKYPGQAAQIVEAFKWATNAWLFFSGVFGGLISGVAIGKAMKQQQDQTPKVNP